MKKILLTLCALLALAPASPLRADESSSLETDYTYPDIENPGGPNWQVAFWPAIRLKKTTLNSSIVQLGFDSVSPYNSGIGPNFLLRVELDGRFVFLTNSQKIADNKPGAIVMQKKGRVFEATLPRAGVLTDAAVDYGKETEHYTAGDLNPGNANDPRFTSLRFIPAQGAPPPPPAAASPAAWEPLSLGIPEYPGGDNWIVATWPAAQGKTIGANAVVRIGFDEQSIYRNAATAKAQNFLCRLVFQNGASVFLTNSAEVARRKGGVIIMNLKDGYFEAPVSGQGEVKEIVVDFGAESQAYGRGAWRLNESNSADVRFNSLKIFPAAKAPPPAPAQPAQPAPAPAPAAAPKPALAAPSASASADLQTKAEYSTPAYYGGDNWLVAVFTNARGLNLSGKNTTLRLHFDNASCFNTDENVSFLLRVVLDNGETVYASNSDKIVSAAASGKTARFTLDKTDGCYEGALVGLGAGGAVSEIAVDFGESTSHLPVPLNEKNANNPRFTKLTVLEQP